MARRKQSPFEDIIDITSKLPWWVGILLAIVSYLFLHAYAIREVIPPTNSQNLSQTMATGLFRSLALFGQYILPVAFIVGSGISVLNRLNRKKIHQNVTNSPSKDVLDDMSWQQFEILVGEYYRQEGYKVEEVGGGGADGGVDLILHKNEEKYLIQCKQWKAYKVGVKPVRELLGVMVGSGASGGIVVTSGEFSRDAISYARENRIQLVNGAELHRMIRSAQQIDTAQVSPQKDPICPKCGSGMIKRIAKKGTRAGEQFWGCSRFPACRSTRSIKN
ncbi:MAG: restriction endonuclease [Desulfobulbaceae bacterium]|nr:restriction endonuclease [Desulfobulbaceae bacterium]